jgi:hypothetical protein
VPSYISDSYQVIKTIESSQFEAKDIILTADVVALYPSIDINLGLIALRRRLSTAAGFTSSKADLITDLVAWVLNNNYIVFGNTIWHQITGTAMGTPLAVTFAIIYMAELEATALAQCEAKYADFIPPKLYLRYIDDIFSVLNSSQDADYLMTELNNIHANIKFTHTIDNVKGIFLDMEIFKGKRFAEDGRLDTRLYTKPLNKHLLLPYGSFHRAPLFKAMIQAGLKRRRLLCSSNDDYTTERDAFYQQHVNAGYPTQYLDKVFEMEWTRQELVNPKIEPKQESIQPLIFKTINTPRTSAMKLASCFKIPEYLWADIHAPYIFNAKRPPIICYQNPPSLAKSLTSSSYPFKIDEDGTDHTSTCHVRNPNLTSEL